ncbi:MAG: hypothetical protein OXQ84_17515 [bacterium]|nr:hypothetical protein [bacterium]
MMHPRNKYVDHFSLADKADDEAFTDDDEEVLDAIAVMQSNV